MKTKRLFWAAVALMVAAAYGGRAYAATTHDHSGWKELSGILYGSLSGNYVLTGDLNIYDVPGSVSEVAANETVVICLNGHKIYGGLLKVRQGASLTICDCTFVHFKRHNTSNSGTNNYS